MKEILFFPTALKITKHFTIVSIKTKIKSIKHLKVSSRTSALQDSINTQLHSIFPDDSHLIQYMYRLLPW